MKQENLIELLQLPELSDPAHVIELEKIVRKYPYFQSARALFLKGLYHQNSFKYNTVLKETAAFTTDRGILFDFITSQNFKSISFIENQTDEIEKTNEADVVLTEIEIETNKIGFLENETLLTENNHQENEENKTLEDKLEIGKPLVFDTNETHSFEEWLKLTQLKPIHRVDVIPEESLNVANAKNTITNFTEKDLEVEKPAEISKKIALIDKFIEANPKITPKKEEISAPNILSQTQDSSQLMTETLAKIYLEQKKYQRAIQAYEILILKYPEKSYFFADRIEDIKKLQQNNS